MLPSRAQRLAKRQKLQANTSTSSTSDAKSSGGTTSSRTTTTSDTSTDRSHDRSHDRRGVGAGAGSRSAVIRMWCPRYNVNLVVTRNRVMKYECD